MWLCTSHRFVSFSCQLPLALLSPCIEACLVRAPCHVDIMVSHVPPQVHATPSGPVALLYTLCLIKPAGTGWDRDWHKDRTKPVRTGCGTESHEVRTGHGTGPVRDRTGHGTGPVRDRTG